MNKASKLYKYPIGAYFFKYEDGELILLRLYKATWSEVNPPKILKYIPFKTGTLKFLLASTILITKTALSQKNLFILNSAFVIPVRNFGSFITTIFIYSPPTF